MAEYIGREALIAEFKRLKLGENSFIERVFADGVYAIIEQFPAADVAPVVHGRWIMHDDELGLTCECSSCHIETIGDGNYCPNCGARMKGESGDDAAD